jgi:hypothetical protein
VINCVDQGDFSSGVMLNINKSITIDCEGVQGRFGFNLSDNAIVVEASATDIVVLRGLDIDGNGVSERGIIFVSGAALHVEHCVIRNVNGANSGWGILDQPLFSGTTELFVSDTVLENNGAGSVGGGISIEPVIASGLITRATLNRVEARNNYFGIKADGVSGGASGGVINLTVRDSVSSGNRSNGIVATSNASGPSIIMMVRNTTSSQNATAGFGVIADGPKTTITLSGSTVTGNINGIGASNSGVLASYQNNDVTMNSVNGSPTVVLAPE